MQMLCTTREIRQRRDDFELFRLTTMRGSCRLQSSEVPFDAIDVMLNLNKKNVANKSFRLSISLALSRLPHQDTMRPKEFRFRCDCVEATFLWVCTVTLRAASADDD